MARPRTVSDADVLRAARAVFLRHGPAAPVAEVAARVGLSQPGLFRRFGDKAQLLRRALAPEPIDPAAILGAPDEPARLGTGPHLEALALRLLNRLADTLEATHLLAQGGGLDAEALAELHAAHGVEAFAHALVHHLAQLPGLAVPPERAAEALVLLVHGAALMRMAGGAHGDAEAMLGRSVRVLAEEEDGPV